MSPKKKPVATLPRSKAALTAGAKGNFMPVLNRFEHIAKDTHTAAMAMIEAETSDRLEKTAKLRKARLEREASEHAATKKAANS